MRASNDITRHGSRYTDRINTSEHFAIIKQRGKIIASAKNRAGSRSSACGCNDQTMHAECAVLKDLGDLSLLRGCVMIVFRLNKQNQVRQSMPCCDCQVMLTKCMKKWGLRRVEYSE
jgi:hypothetical protein